MVSFGPATTTREEFTPINEVDGEVWVARGWRLGTSSWGWQEEEWVPYQAPSADEVALVARDARVLAYEVCICLLTCMLSCVDSARFAFLCIYDHKSRL